MAAGKYEVLTDDNEGLKRFARRVVKSGVEGANISDSTLQAAERSLGWPGGILRAIIVEKQMKKQERGRVQGAQARTPNEDTDRSPRRELTPKERERIRHRVIKDRWTW